MTTIDYQVKYNKLKSAFDLVKHDLDCTLITLEEIAEGDICLDTVSAAERAAVVLAFSIMKIGDECGYKGAH